FFQSPPPLRLASSRTSACFMSCGKFWDSRAFDADVIGIEAVSQLLATVDPGQDTGFCAHASSRSLPPLPASSGRPPILRGAGGMFWTDCSAADSGAPPMTMYTQ